LSPAYFRITAAALPITPDDAESPENSPPSSAAFLLFLLSALPLGGVADDYESDATRDGPFTALFDSI